MAMNTSSQVRPRSTSVAECSVNYPPAAIPDHIAVQLSRNWDIDLYLSFFPQVNQAGRDYLLRALKAPARNPGGTRSNTTRYPSLKTRQTFTAESDSELAAALVADQTDDVLFFVEQPPRINLQYPTSRSTATTYTIPDAVFFYRNGPVVIEVKQKPALAKLAITEPHRYKSIEGVIRSEPVEHACAAYGLPFRIIADDQLNPNLVRNIRFLTPYYRTDLRAPITDEERDLVISTIKAEPGISMLRLPIADGSRRADLVYCMIARREIFAPMSRVDLRAQEKLQLFDSIDREKAFAVFAGRESQKQDVALPLAHEFAPGTEFTIRRHRFTVVGHQPDGIRVLNQRSNTEEDISFAVLRDAGVKLQVSETGMAFQDLLSSLNHEALKAFLKNYRLVAPYLPGGARYRETPKHRNTRRLLHRYKIAERSSGAGERGLLSQVSKRGNRSPRKTISNEILNRLLDSEFKQPTAPTASFVYGLYKEAVLEQQLPKNEWYCYRTIARRVRELDKYYTPLKRQGKRVALPLRAPHAERSLLGPPNGMASYAVGHIDHTLMDVLVEHPLHPGVYVRPWISAMVDSYDGRILAAVLWFDHPNTDIVFELLKECLRRHGVIPCKIQCDWGAEFRSTAVQTALAAANIALGYRLKGEPRSGSPIETSFKKMNVAMFHNLKGNTKILQNAREATAAVQPQNFACWKYEEMKKLVNDYISTHNNTPREYSPSPQEMYESYIAHHGRHYASWMTPSLIDRLSQIPAQNDTRIVSKSATIRVRSVDYTDDALHALRGQEVHVHITRDDPRYVFVENPHTRFQIKCRCCNSDIMYAESAEEALAIIEKRMSGSYQRVQKRHTNYGKFAAQIREREAAMEAAKSATLAARPEPTPTAQPSSNGFVDIDSVPVATFAE